MKSLVAAALLAAGLAGCAAVPTTFAPAAPQSAASGFWDSRIEADRYRVSYRGGAGASPALVRDYALLHAADLAVADGYDWFRVVGGYGETRGGSGPRLTIGGGSGGYGRRGYAGVGVGLAVPLSDGPQLTQTIEVLMGKGLRPAGADCYDARDMQRSIRGRSRGLT